MFIRNLYCYNFAWIISCGPSDWAPNGTSRRYPTTPWDVPQYQWVPMGPMHCCAGSCGVSRWIRWSHRCFTSHGRSRGGMRVLSSSTSCAHTPRHPIGNPMDHSHLWLTRYCMYHLPTYADRTNVVERGCVKRSFQKIKPVCWLSLFPLLFTAGGIAWSHHLARCICGVYSLSYNLWPQSSALARILIVLDVNGWKYQFSVKNTHLLNTRYPMWHAFVVVLVVFSYSSSVSQAPHTSHYELVVMVEYSSYTEIKNHC